MLSRGQNTDVTAAVCAHIPVTRTSGDPWPKVGRNLKKKAPEATGIIALVESPEGIANLREIASVPGIKGLIIGPCDLSVSSGWNGNLGHPELISILEKSVDVTIAAGVVPIVPVFGPNLESNYEQIRKWKKKGVRVFTAACDKALLGESAGAYNRALRKEEE